jgi:uncharacterized membrane protein YoaK (UPF0700 family)
MFRGVLTDLVHSIQRVISFPLSLLRISALKSVTTFQVRAFKAHVMSGEPLFYFLSSNVVVLILAFVGGFVDSAGYIKLFGLFTSSITGNLVVACAALFKNTDGVFSRVFVTILFAIGAFITSLMSLRLRNVHRMNQWYIGVILISAEIVTLILATAVAMYIESAHGFPVLDSWQCILVGSIIALSMGIHSAAALEMIKNCPSTNVMTANIVKTSMAAANAMYLFSVAQGVKCRAGCALENSEDNEKVREARVSMVDILLVVLLFILGAGAGAALTVYISFWCLFVPVALLMVVVLSIFLAKRRHDSVVSQALHVTAGIELTDIDIP